MEKNILMPHNLKVYEELEKELLKKRIVLLQNATGGGKSYLTAELLNRHNWKAVVLSPKLTINNQWLSDIKEKYALEISLITYQAFSHMDDDQITHLIKEYDLLVCDEAHHVGAKVWKKNFLRYQELVGERTDRYILGLTADPVRYLDNGIDVADEFFHGNIVKGYSVGELIDMGIMKPFLYVSALYDFPERLRQEKSSFEDKSLSALKSEYIHKLFRKLDFTDENMYGIKTIIQKHLPSGPNKILVFVSSIEDIPLAKEKLSQVFTCPFFDMHSGKSEKENMAEKDAFLDCAGDALLFSINQLNEGVHIPGINVVIMLRKTISPTIFQQQLGRVTDCLDDDRSLVVFDIVANHAAIKIAQRSTEAMNDLFVEWNGEISDEKRQIIVKDYVQDALEVLAQIDAIKGDGWMPAEDQYLLEHYKKDGPSKCAVALNRTESSCGWRARVLGLTIQNNVPIDWTEEKIQYLRSNIQTMSLNDMSEKLNISTASITRKCNELNLSRKKKLRWTPEMENFLKENFSEKGATFCSKEMGISVAAVRGKAKNMGLTKKRAFVGDKKETLNQYLKENYGSKGPKKCAEELGLTYTTCLKKASDLGLRYRNIVWTEEQVDFLKENYSTMEMDALAKTLDKTPTQICQKASSMKLGYRNRLQWSDEKLDQLSKFRQTHTIKECAEEFGASQASIYNLLKKTKGKAG